MLYDELPVQGIVDRASAHEFLKEATRLASSDELRDLGDRLAAKSRRFAAANIAASTRVVISGSVNAVDAKRMSKGERASSRAATTGQASWPAVRGVPVGGPTAGSRRARA